MAKISIYQYCLFEHVMQAGIGFDKLQVGGSIGLHASNLLHPDRPIKDLDFFEACPSKSKFLQTLNEHIKHIETLPYNIRKNHAMFSKYLCLNSVQDATRIYAQAGATIPFCWNDVPMSVNRVNFQFNFGQYVIDHLVEFICSTLNRKMIIDKANEQIRFNDKSTRTINEIFKRISPVTSKTGFDLRDTEWEFPLTVDVPHIAFNMNIGVTIDLFVPERDIDISPKVKFFPFCHSNVPVNFQSTAITVAAKKHIMNEKRSNMGYDTAVAKHRIDLEYINRKKAKMWRGIKNEDSNDR